MTPTDEPIRLTAHARAAGCSCKIPQAALREILSGSGFQPPVAGLLVGNDHADDAAAMVWQGDELLLATTDFFTPIVDDAHDFGRIAAANALSDIYAMGGRPVLALAILGWPEALPAALASAVLQGARKVCAEAGIPLAGGHSILSSEPFFGLSVSGRCTCSALKTNSGAQAGDFLLLTKPLGVGILSAASKRGALEEVDYPAMVAQLSKLNAVGAVMGNIPGVTAMTDVTGFGLGGHLLEMTTAANLTARISWNTVPLLDAARKYATAGISPDAAFKNWNSLGDACKIDQSVDMMEAFRFLPDPQTNGGLLISVRPDALEEAQAVLISNGYAGFTSPIGQMEVAGEARIMVDA